MQCNPFRSMSSEQPRTICPFQQTFSVATCGNKTSTHLPSIEFHSHSAWHIKTAYMIIWCLIRTHTNTYNYCGPSPKCHRPAITLETCKESYSFESFVIQKTSYKCSFVVCTNQHFYCSIHNKTCFIAKTFPLFVLIWQGRAHISAYIQCMCMYLRTESPQQLCYCGKSFRP